MKKVLIKLGLPVMIVGMTICVFSCEKEAFLPTPKEVVVPFEKGGKLDPPPSVDEYGAPPKDTTLTGGA